MKELKDVSLQLLGDLFQVATDDAALEAKSHGLPPVGLDFQGKLREAPKPKEPPDDLWSGNVVA
jgi:hypothetical protein